MTALDYFFLGVLATLVVAAVVGGLWIAVGRRRTALAGVLRRFFGIDPQQLAIVSRSLPKFELANIQNAIDDFAREKGASVRAIGYTAAAMSMENSLRSLLASQAFFGKAQVAPPTLREVDIDVGRTLLCVESGMHLISAASERIAVNVYTAMMGFGDLTMEVAARTSAEADSFIKRLREHMQANNVLRGKILSLETDTESSHGCGTRIRFHAPVCVDRSDIILPDETLRLLERNTIGFFRYAADLKACGRSVKRGVLLHGEPGTGKTFTAKWLARSLEGVTVVLMSGEELAYIKDGCRLARALAPALVIMEDVDLIATDRAEVQRPMHQLTLHQLLNELDGMPADAEVLFLLTTNRPDAIEKAVAGRPGRIDQALEYPLPDADCRQRLIELYSRGTRLDLKLPEDLIERLEGSSPAFIKELVRKATFAAIEDGAAADGVTLTDVHFQTALNEMLLGGGELTRRLFGFARSSFDE